MFQNEHTQIIDGSLLWLNRRLMMLLLCPNHCHFISLICPIIRAYFLFILDVRRQNWILSSLSSHLIVLNFLSLVSYMDV